MYYVHRPIKPRIVLYLPVHHTAQLLPPSTSLFGSPSLSHDRHVPSEQCYPSPTHVVVKKYLLPGEGRRLEGRGPGTCPIGPMVNPPLTVHRKVLPFFSIYKCTLTLIFKKLTHPTPGGLSEPTCDVAMMFVPLFVCLWLYGWQLYTLHLLISGHDRRTAPKFGSHVRIDKYSHLKKNVDPPHLGDFRGLSIVINLSRRTAPKFGTHVRIDTLTLNIFLPTPPGGG